MAEACGSRTHLSAFGRDAGFEDQEGHRPHPASLLAAFAAFVFILEYKIRTEMSRQFFELLKEHLVDRDRPELVGLGPPDGDPPLLEIHVRPAEAEEFALPHPRVQGTDNPLLT